jgi:ribosome recycling factor
VPGGIKYGQYFLNVQFPGSLIRVPFRILTDEEEKMLEKNYKDIRKQVQQAFAPKKGL